MIIHVKPDLRYKILIKRALCLKINFFKIKLVTYQ